MNTEVQQPASREESDEDVTEELDWNTDNMASISFTENLDETDATHHNIPHPTYIAQNDMARRRDGRSKFSRWMDRGLEMYIYPFMRKCCRNKLVWFIIFQFFLLFLRITRSLDSFAAVFLIIIPIVLITVYIIYKYCKHSMQRSRYRSHRPYRSEYPMHHISPHAVDERVLQQLVFQTLRHRLETIRENNNGDNRNPSRDDFVDFRRDIRNMLMELQNFDERIFAMGPMPQAQPLGLTPEEIAGIKVENYAKEKDKEYDTCSICIDEFKESENVRKLNCGHIYHLNCIDQWLKQSTSCPNCKSELRVGGNNNENNLNFLDMSLDREPVMTIIEIPDIVDNNDDEFIQNERLV